MLDRLARELEALRGQLGAVAAPLAAAQKTEGEPTEPDEGGDRQETM